MEMYGKNIKELRENAGLTQTELAKKIGSNQKQISKWENGVIEPNIQQLKKLADFFDETIDYIVNNNNYDYNFKYEHNGTKLIHKERNNKK